MKPCINKNIYFTQEHENAIIEYCRIDNKQRKEYLYNVVIGPVLDEVLNKIIYTYKFTSLPNIVLLRDECKVWLVTVLDKFNPEKGYKAFSYFSVIIKNYFIHKVKKSSQQQTREIQYDEIPKDVEHQYMTVKNDYVLERERKEYFQYLKSEINSWMNVPNLKDNDKKVIEAIQILFENVDNIEIFNKKAFYLYIREITSLSTKQIVSSLSRIKEKYAIFRDKWESGNL